jgi:hypothetical protein
MGEAAIAFASNPSPPLEGASIVELTIGEEILLRAYFARYLPPAPGAGSSFGGMCSRLSNARNPATTERPTPFVVRSDGTAAGAVWTEILDCGRGSSSSASDGEDAMIAHIDALRCLGRVRRALATLSAGDQRVLDVHYASDRTTGPLGRLAAVGALTSAARIENRRRAVDGRHELIQDTLDSLVKTAPGSAAGRAHTRALLAAVRAEATALLSAARTSYARAWREVW